MKNPFEDLADFSELEKMAEQGTASLAPYLGDFSELFPENDTQKELSATPSRRKKNDFDTTETADRHVKVKPTFNRHQMRRAVSELALEKELPWHFEQGISYHCISHGDIDALTYLRVIVKQQKIRYALLSSWVMASEDIAEIRNWIERGYIGRMDFYIGEIFKASYFKQYEELISLCKTFGGRVCMARNHSKVIAIFGERFDAVIESSANVNTNPRIEQTCITVDSELAKFYKDFFDGLISFERDFDDIQPWSDES